MAVRDRSGKSTATTGAVTLFANVTLDGVPNSGPALGALAFDPASRQLFVADRDTGMIHRFTLDGVERGRFDHGMQALAALGLPPIAFDPRKRLNIRKPGIRQRQSGHLGLCAGGAARVRHGGSIVAVSITRSPRACASGRWRSCPTARSDAMRASKSRVPRGAAAGRGNFRNSVRR